MRFPYTMFTFSVADPEANPMFFGHPDPLATGTDPDSSIIKQKL